MTESLPGPDRRDFLAAAVASTLAFRSAGPARIAADRPWIPPDGFLADLPRLMRLASVPAVSIAVVEKGAVHWSRAIGVANASTGVPVTDGSLFAAASLGKAVFATMVMGLVREGKIGLDQPLASYVRPADLPTDPRLDRITPRHVLSHSSGLRNWRNRDQQLLPDFDPGTRFQYSGEGFTWLQRVVEAVTGKGVDRVMRERLFDPVGMPTASYAWSRAAAATMVYGHGNRGAVGNQFARTTGDKLLVIAERRGKPLSDWTTDESLDAVVEMNPNEPRLPNSIGTNVAFSLLCTPTEYAKFIAFLMGPLPAASRDAMLTSTTPVEGTLSWGLGVGLEKRAEGTLFWHWGDNGVFRAYMVGDPVRRRAIAVFTNADSGPRIYQRVIRAATGLDLDGFVWV